MAQGALKMGGENGQLFFREPLVLLKEEKTVVEGAWASGLAALMANREFFAGKHVGIILNVSVKPLPIL